MRPRPPQISHFVIALFFTTTALASGELKTQPFEFSLSDRAYSCDRVIPSEGHPISRLAQFGETQLLGLKVIICDEVLGSTRANGAYHNKTNTLILATPNLELLAYVSTLKHELLHAQLWANFRRGQNLGFHGLAYNSDPSVETRHYGAFFGLDEILTTLASLRHVAQEAEEALPGDSKGAQGSMALVIDALERSRWYTGRFNLMLKTLREGLQLGKLKVLTSTPDSLAILGSTIPLQEITSERVRLVIPQSSSVKVRENLLKLSEEVLASSKKIEDLVFEIGRARSSGGGVLEAQKALDEIASLNRLFVRYFPEAVGLLEENENLWLKLSTP